MSHFYALAQAIDKSSLVPWLTDIHLVYNERICAALGWVVANSTECIWRSPEGAEQQPPLYTTSVDAAIGLVPADTEWSITHIIDKQGNIYHGSVDNSDGFEKSPALALCVAGLYHRHWLTTAKKAPILMSHPFLGTSILQTWVMGLPIRHQGVLITATRGVDNAPKENSAKPIVRAIRGQILNAADSREIGLPSAFLAYGFSETELVNFLKDWDHYPIHFVQHLLHAIQIIGYKHPKTDPQVAFRVAYNRMVHKLHLNPETEAQMDERLTEDRIALYNAANPPE